MRLSQSFGYGGGDPQAFGAVAAGVINDRSAAIPALDAIRATSDTPARMTCFIAAPNATGTTANLSFAPRDRSSRSSRITAAFLGELGVLDQKNPNCDHSDTVLRLAAYSAPITTMFHRPRILMPVATKYRSTGAFQMDNKTLDLPTSLSSAARAIWAALLNSWRMLMIVEADSYRPEAYYMRGPGPKWREKHQSEA